jgi:hypothetical protein
VRHRLFSLASALSLLLCVAVCVMWVRSFKHCSDTTLNLRTFYVNLNDANGVVGGAVVHDFAPDRPAWQYRREPVRREDMPGSNWVTESGSGKTSRVQSVAPNAWGFGVHDAGPTPGGSRGAWAHGGRRMWIIWVPYWLPALLTAALPAEAIYRIIRQRRRRSAGQCKVCGYDLRATPDRCPECGAQPAAVG